MATKKKVGKVAENRKSGGDDSLTPEEAARMIGKRCTKEAIRKALVSGDMRGRDLGGSVGWVTTRQAVLDYIDAGNRAAQVVDGDT